MLGTKSIIEWVKSSIYISAWSMTLLSCYCEELDPDYSSLISLDDSLYSSSELS